MKKELRYYQQEVCQEIAKAWGRKERPYASLITGTGKSLVLAALTNRYMQKDERVLQLVPRKELVEQNYNELLGYTDNHNSIGIVCGQLNLKQNHKQVVIAMASSFVNICSRSGKFDKLLIDECHRLSIKQSDKKQATYQKIVETLLKLNPEMKVCGVTGTPYRLDQGELHEESYKSIPFFTHKVYDTAINPGLKKLIEDGYLSHIETLNTTISVNLDGVKKSGDDFNSQQAGVKFDAIIDNAINDMRKRIEQHNIQTGIIFASSIANAQKILKCWDNPDSMRIICGDHSVCSKQQRIDAIEWIKNGTGRRFIVNVDILTEGFDFKALELVVLLRATMSPGLLVQMVGRVIRPHDDKTQGYLLDYGTNIERLTFGGIENIIIPGVPKLREIVPKKTCTSILDDVVYFEDKTFYPGTPCDYENIISAKKCKKCGAEFISESEDGKYSMRTKAQALEIKRNQTYTYDVFQCVFESYTKGDNVMIKMLLYDSAVLLHTEYICLEHEGGAKFAAIAKLKSIMKNPKNDWYQIGKFEGGHNIKNMLFLLNEYYDQYFKTIKTVTLKDTENGKFKQLVSFGF